MINPSTLIQLKAFARQDGLFLGLYWTVSFALTMMIPESALGSLMALSTPFFMGWRLCAFRDKALDGVISFRRGFAYCVYSVLYASLVFALAQYIYFRFLDNGNFMSIMNNGVNAIEEVYKQQNIDTSELHKAVESMGKVTPMEWTFAIMMQNIFLGALLGLPVAAVCTKKA
ncbi:MAG: DUF4199 domain-containing protein [Prevotella sp.]|nr:DUF4199 domain-containing protein [Prevotella sp.]